ncbi:Kelch repeat-containing protein 3 [Stygiomarasmius scandens]|uniref:Kelch repeat-containing protein 3 n=1 Tax=Marasmiellus scandens TaxID=2682957 RepID=A0ABR1IZG1_9AGAR
MSPQDEWRKFVSPTCPGPRSAHAVAATAASGGKLFLFGTVTLVLCTTFTEWSFAACSYAYFTARHRAGLLGVFMSRKIQPDVSSFLLAVTGPLLGGEFSSLHQTTFHHYRDFWVFDIATHSWDRIETKVRPTARSGHRMAMWKHYVVLFGGFYDPGMTTRYLNDLWIFNTQEYNWRQVEFRDNEIRPSPRSGFSFLSTPDGIILHGGYCKEHVKGKRPIGIMLDDTWFLKMSLDDETIRPEAAPVTSSTKPKSSKSAGQQNKKDPLSLKWERRKRPSTAYAPTLRSGCTMAAWTAKNTGVMFGGVTDEDTSEEVLESVFWNDLNGYQWTGKGRWVSMTLRKPKKSKNKGPKWERQIAKAPGALTTPPQFKDMQLDDDQEYADNTEANDNEIIYDSDREDAEGDDEDNDEKKALAKVTSKVQTISIADIQAKRARAEAAARLGVDTDEIDPNDPTLTVPLPRYNAMLAVLRNTLFIYGGIFEKGSHEYTLDDFYSIQLDKMDRYVSLKQSTIVIPDGDVESSSDDDDDDSESDDDDDDCGGHSTVADVTVDEEEESGLAKKIEPVTEEDKEEDTESLTDIRTQATALLGVTKDAVRSPDDALSTPLPGETLTLFYARSREYWSQQARTISDKKGKQLKREGFRLAEERYASYKPVLEEVEKILAEAGLDEEEMKKGAVAAGPGGAGQSRNRR